MSCLLFNLFPRRDRKIQRCSKLTQLEVRVAVVPLVIILSWRNGAGNRYCGKSIKQLLCSNCGIVATWAVGSWTEHAF